MQVINITGAAKQLQLVRLREQSDWSQLPTPKIGA